jgi:hypothetical protein
LDVLAGVDKLNPFYWRGFGEVELFWSSNAISQKQFVEFPKLRHGEAMSFWEKCNVIGMVDDWQVHVLNSELTIRGFLPGFGLSWLMLSYAKKHMGLVNSFNFYTVTK